MSNKNHMDFWSALGANPTPLAFSELYFALQSGTVDAEENASDTIVNSNFNEVQKYLADTNISCTPTKWPSTRKPMTAWILPTRKP